MNMFLQSISTKYQPQIALVVYKKSDTNHSAHSPEEDHYLEAHHFYQVTPGTFQPGSGKPIGERTLQMLAKSLSKRKAKKEKVFTYKSMLIPQNVLYSGQSNNSIQLTWYLEHPTKKLHFSKELGIPNGEVTLPNLLFHLSMTGRNTQLKVYSFKDNSPNLKTILFQAPFHNTKKDGVCMGTAVIKIKTHYWEDVMLQAELSFFNSYFTHIFGDNPIKGNLNTTLTKCISNKTTFPEEVLIPLNKTLEQLLQS